MKTFLKLFVFIYLLSCTNSNLKKTEIQVKKETFYKNKIIIYDYEKLGINIELKNMGKEIIDMKSHYSKMEDGLFGNTEIIGQKMKQIFKIDSLFGMKNNCPYLRLGESNLGYGHQLGKDIELYYFIFDCYKVNKLPIQVENMSVEIGFVVSFYQGRAIQIMGLNTKKNDTKNRLWAKYTHSSDIEEDKNIESLPKNIFAVAHAIPKKREIMTKRPQWNDFYYTYWAVNEKGRFYELKEHNYEKWGFDSSSNPDSDYLIKD